MRPIDADALIDEFEWCKQQAAECNRKEWDEIITRVSKQPTVDAVPVRHGYNKQFKFPSQFTCSLCGWESWDTYCGDTDTFNYCPNCGAKMDGADGERRSDEDQHIYD